MTMDNVKLTVKGHTLVIEVDLLTRLGPSASGKTIGVASTRGFVPVLSADKAHDDIRVSLNVVTKK